MVGADRPRGPNGLGHDLAAAHVERPAEPAERRVEVCERLAEKRAPAGGRAEARTADAVVEDEQRQHRLGGLDRCRERRVVVDAQVPGEEDDRDLHGAKL